MHSHLWKMKDQEFKSRKRNWFLHWLFQDGGHIDVSGAVQCGSIYTYLWISHHAIFWPESCSSEEDYDSYVALFLTHVIMTSEDVECGVIDCFHVFYFFALKAYGHNCCCLFLKILKKKSLIIHWWLVIFFVVVFWLFCDFFTVFTSDFFLSSVLYFIKVFFFLRCIAKIMMWLNKYCIIYV